MMGGKGASMVLVLRAEENEWLVGDASSLRSE